MKHEQINLLKGNFSQVPNELLEFLISQEMSGLEFRICLFLIRNLTGWNYEIRPFSIADFSTSLKADEKKIIKALSNLVKLKILKKVKIQGIRSHCYGFNKETIGRVLIGKNRKYYLDGPNVIDLQTFKILKVSNLAPSECQSLHLEGVQNGTFKTPNSAPIAAKQTSKYSEIHLNTLKKENFEILNPTTEGGDWVLPPEDILKKYPQFFKGSTA